MTNGQKFCTECGAPLVPQNRFCGQCGHPVPGASTAPAAPAIPAQPLKRNAVPPQQEAGCERILGIVPFIEQGVLSVTRYTLVVTTRRLIFSTWDPEVDEAMSDAEDDVMQESCDIAETTDEIAHFRTKDWADGPWTRYRSMDPDTIAASAPGSIIIPIASVTRADILCETKRSTQDTLYIEMEGTNHEFDLMHSQGRFLETILCPILHDRLEVADKLHARGKIDRLLSGRQYE